MYILFSSDALTAGKVTQIRFPTGSARGDEDAGLVRPAWFPMNALERNSFTRALRVVRKKLPKPKAVCVVSAHSVTSGCHCAGSPACARLMGRCLRQPIRGPNSPITRRKRRSPSTTSNHFDAHGVLRARGYLKRGGTARNGGASHCQVRISQAGE